MRKLDIHCHILPGLDDGSKSMKETMKILKMARRQNIISAIATPHYSPHYRNDNPEEIKELCRLTEKQAQEVVDPEFRIYPGQEIFFSDEVLEKLKRGELLTLAGSDYVLIEFMPDVPYSNLQRVVRDLTMERYLPILAHIERYDVLREDGRVEELTELGAYMQMNYRHIGGKWYSDTARWCRKMLKESRIHFLATDSHDMRTRYPATTDAELWVQKHLDKEYIRNLFYKNAKKILINQKI